MDTADYGMGRSMLLCARGPPSSRIHHIKCSLMAILSSRSLRVLCGQGCGRSRNIVATGTRDCAASRLLL